MSTMKKADTWRWSLKVCHKILSNCSLCFYYNYKYNIIIKNIAKQNLTELKCSNEEIEEYLATGNFPGFKGSSNGVTPRINAVQTDIDDSQIPTNPTATYNPEPRPAQVNNYQPQQSTAYNPPRYNYDPIVNPLGGDRRRV